QMGGYNRYTMDEVLRPFELTAAMCHMHWMTPMVVYWARRLKPDVLQTHAKAYGQWLESPLPGGGSL
ncbi:MAG: NAD(P)H-dependent oxidoreductase, partial [Enterobacterales bacterium]|nr:NAD(P)H-dependent oxidoreductase [Enterobacterales bacterium]